MKKISVRGPIIPSNHQWIYDLFEIEATSPKKVNDALEEANGDDVEVHINSGGGSVFDGSDIYTALKDYNGDVTVKIVGIAASAASFIAMGGKKVLMSPTAQIMIHNASTIAWGDHREMEGASEMLKSTDKTIANAYRLKSGMSESELLAMMQKETWMTPQQARDYKLVDEIMFENEVLLTASVDKSGLLPQQVIDKVRNELFKNTAPAQSPKGDIKPDGDFSFMNDLRMKKLDLLEVM